MLAKHIVLLDKKRPPSSSSSSSSFVAAYCFRVFFLKAEKAFCLLVLPVVAFAEKAVVLPVVVKVVVKVVIEARRVVYNVVVKVGKSAPATTFR